MTEAGADMDETDLPMEHAQSGISAAVLEQDLETIAEYIVHLREDQIHKIAVQVKQDEFGNQRL